MKVFCVLLNGGIANDARVLKTIRSLSKKFIVHLYYVISDERDDTLFNENVTLFLVKSPYSNFNKKLRINLFFYRVYNFLAFEALKSNMHYDYVWANDLPTLLPAVRIKQSLGRNTQLIYDSHEIYTETLNQFFDTNTSLVKKMIFTSLIYVMRFFGKKKEKLLLKEVDYFITVGEAVADYFHNHLKYKRPIVIKNCPLFIEHITKSNLLRETFDIKNNEIVFLYQGVLNKGRALHVVLQAFLKAEDNVKLIVLGNGLLEKELKSIVKNSGIINKVFFKDKVDFKDLFKYTNSADYGINYVEPLNQSKKLASPNKVFEYIQNELPILMSDSTENKNINIEFNIGVCTSLIENSILEGIDKIQAINSSQLNTNLKKAKKTLNWETQEKVLLGLFK